MSARWLEEAMVLSGLGGATEYPRHLADEIAMCLPITVVELQALSVALMSAWLRERGIEHSSSGSDRRLHGCIVARNGCGIAFLDSEDSEDERRFTFAHELSHFILEHLMPRARAERALGKGILPVLNGERAPTNGEDLSAILEGIVLGTHIHLMARGPSGAVCTWDVENGEQRADRLALELLAPRSRAITEIRRLFGQQWRDADAEVTGALLAKRFGLPRGTAETYAALLKGKTRGTGPLTLELFGSI